VGGEPELQGCPVLAFSVDGGPHRSTGVDYEHVSGFEEVREIPKAGVENMVVLPVGDHQAHLIASQAAGLRWLPGL
jgi:hypothetical protein